MRVSLVMAYACRVMALLEPACMLSCHVYYAWTTVLLLFYFFVGLWQVDASCMEVGVPSSQYFVLFLTKTEVTNLSSCSVTSLFPVREYCV